MCSVWSVTNPALSDARNTAARAISPGRAMRPSRTEAVIVARNSGMFHGHRLRPTSGLLLTMSRWPGARSRVDEKLPLKFGSVFLLRANVARPVRGKGDNRCYYLPILSASLSADAVLIRFEPTRANLATCRPSPHSTSFRLNA
jgi:hypothetical protein